MNKLPTYMIDFYLILSNYIVEMVLNNLMKLIKTRYAVV